MLKLTIDDKVVEIEEGKTVLDAANQAGIDIPTVCYHEALSCTGSCRVCVVEISTNGKSALATACTFPVSAGMKVSTKSEKAIEARRLAVELLLAQRPHSDKIQEIGRKLGIKEPRLTLKQRDCILCALCVRTCCEQVGPDAISFVTQGKGRNVEPTVAHSLEKCIGCDSCAYICPTKAITVEDVGDTRTLSTPGGKLKFKLKKCKTCGKYWAPEKQLDYIIKKWNLEPDIFDTCPDCRV